MNTFRLFISYLIAKIYQFVATFPHFEAIAIPFDYQNMSWWHLTHFLCLLSNKICPDKIGDDLISRPMLQAMLDRMDEETRKNFIKDLEKQATVVQK